MRSNETFRVATVGIIMERNQSYRVNSRNTGRGRTSYHPSSSSFRRSHRSPGDHSKQPNNTTCIAVVDDDSGDPPSFVGTCPFRCPVGERAQRERLRDLAVFERLNGDPYKSSSELAVKKFCRTISTKHVQASDVRPLPVLEDTLNYLLHLLEECKEHPFEVVHAFIFDRTRSIRQDLSMQNIVNDKVIHMYERMVEFHIISHYKLGKCSDDPNVSSIRFLNMEQLTKTLISLYDLYDTNRSPHSVSKNEALFRSFYVLLHLGPNSPKMDSLSLWFRVVSYSVLKSKEMCFARRVLRYFRLGYYKHFISTIEAEATYLQYCIIETYITEIQALALACINYGGYKLHPYPISDLSKVLIIKELDVESICNDCSLQTSTDETGQRFLLTKQTSFCHPKEGFQNYHSLDSERLERLISEYLGPLSWQVQSSFSSSKDT